MKTIIYARVSTDKQSHESQLQELRAYCKNRGWKEVEEIVDTISGSKFTRTGLDELLRRVRTGKVKTIVCYKLDRLGRSLSHLAQLIHEFQSHKVALVIPSQGIDTTHTNPAAQLQLNILCAVAEFEREVIRERVNAGLAVAKSNGVRLGRPDKLSQYEEQVRALAQEGKGVSAIARKLGLPLSSAHKILRRIRTSNSV